MPNEAVTAAYVNSPFNPNPPPAGLQARPQFEAMPLPTAGAYSSDGTRSIAGGRDGDRIVTLYTQHKETLAYTNTADGAAITIAPKYVAARSIDGTTVLFDRERGAYDLLEKDRSLAVLSDGTVQTKEYGNTVTSLPDGTVIAMGAAHKRQVFPQATFDSKRDLVDNGYLSPFAALNFTNARDNKSLGRLPVILRLFKPSTTNALNTAQWIDAQAKTPPPKPQNHPTPQKQPNPT